MQGNNASVIIIEVQNVLGVVVIIFGDSDSRLTSIRGRGVCLRKRRGVGFEFKAQAPHSKAPLRERGPTDKWKGTGFSGYHEIYCSEKARGQTEREDVRSSCFYTGERGRRRRKMRRRKEKRERSIVFSVAPPFFLKNFPEMQDLRKFFTTKTGLNERTERRGRKREASI